MHVEWSRAKAAANLLKHRVDFAEVREALHDERALTIEDPGYEEQRFRSLVMSPAGTILMVVYALPDAETIRLISARKATRIERLRYFQEP